MQLIGENIHIISKSVRDALVNKNVDFVKNIVEQQSNMDFIDLNVGPAKGNLENILPWLTELVQNFSDKGLSFDTTNIEELKKGFAVRQNSEQTFINSTSADVEKLETLTVLALEYNCNLIALTMNKEIGIPKNADGRMELVFEVYEKCSEKGLDSQKIYFDPLVLPVCVDQGQAFEVLNTIKMIKESFDPSVNTLIGLSNISNGCPVEIRGLINRVFGVMAYGAGLDAAIIDAKDNELVRVFRMLDEKIPQSEIDKLYIKIADMVENFSDISEVEYDKDSPEQVKIIKTVSVLTGSSIYSPSFTQI